MRAVADIFISHGYLSFVRASSLLKKASDPVIAGAARDFSSPKANKKRDSISHRYPE
jgi:hypothetical protein